MRHAVSVSRSRRTEQGLLADVCMPLPGVGEVLFSGTPADDVHSEVPDIQHRPSIPDLSSVLARELHWWLSAQKL